MWEVFFEDNPYIYTNREKLFFEQHFETSEYKNLTNFNILFHVEKGLRPVIPFKDEQSCNRWCQQYIKKENVNMGTVVRAVMLLTNVIRSCWSNHPQDRLSFNQIVYELVEVRNLLTNKQ